MGISPAISWVFDGNLWFMAGSIVTIKQIEQSFIFIYHSIEKTASVGLKTMFYFRFSCERWLLKSWGSPVVTIGFEKLSHGHPLDDARGYPTYALGVPP